MNQRTTLRQLEGSSDPRARAAAALIAAGYPGETSLDELTPGSVTRTLVDALARELERVHEQLGEVYESAFLETSTTESVATLVDGLRPRRTCWSRLRRRS